MKKYKVIAGAVGGLGNKPFYAGDVVTEDNFPKGNVPSLIEQGFLAPIEEAKEVEETEKPAKKKPVKK